MHIFGLKLILAVWILQRAIALVGKLQRSMTVALKSTESTLKSAKSILEEAGQAIAKWFKGLSGQALDSAILKAFQQFDANGSGLLDRCDIQHVSHQAFDFEHSTFAPCTLRASVIMLLYALAGRSSPKQCTLWG